MEFLLIRHGKTLANERKIYSGPDEALSLAGRQGLLLVKRKMIDSKIFYDRIVCSPYKRAMETAEIINFRQVPIETLEGIEEISFGVLEGRTFAQAYKTWGPSLEKWIQDPYGEKPKGGESINELIGRAEFFLSKDYPGKPLFVSHDGFIRACLCVALNKPQAFFTFTIDNGSLTRIRKTEEGYRIQQVNVF